MGKRISVAVDFSSHSGNKTKFFGIEYLPPIEKSKSAPGGVKIVLEGGVLPLPLPPFVFFRGVGGLFFGVLGIYFNPLSYKVCTNYTNYFDFYRK